jgi:hypothetical protein
VKFVPKPRENEAVVFEDFFYCGALRATPSSTCIYSAQVSGSTAPVDAECNHANR